MLTDRQETTLMYTLISGWDTRRCTWGCIYAQRHTRWFFFSFNSRQTNWNHPHTHTHILCLLLSSPSFAVTVLSNTSANSIQPGRWRGLCPLSLCPSAPSLPANHPSPALMWHSLPLSHPSAGVCFDWAKSNLPQSSPFTDKNTSHSHPPLQRF